MVAPLPKSTTQAPGDPKPQTHAPDFNPTDPQAIQQILDLFTDPDLSLRDIAEQNNTTLQALTLWLARPDIAEQLLDLECASVRRARFNISFALPQIARSLNQSLEQAAIEATHLDRLANNFPCFTLRLRYRENIRKSVAHLLRISGFDPTAKHRSETERRRRAEQTARFHAHCGLRPSTPNPRSETPNPKSDSSAPHSEFRASSSHYMIIAADEHGRTNIRGLTIPPELNKPGHPFTPVFDDTSDTFDPSDLSVPSVPFTPPEDTLDDNQETEDDEAPFDFSNFSILSTRILASLGLLSPDFTDVEVAHGMILIQNAIGELDEEIRGLPLEEIVEKVLETVGEHPSFGKKSKSRAASCAPPESLHLASTD